MFAVTKYLSGLYSRITISKEYGIDENTLANWIRKYKANGIDGLKKSLERGKDIPLI